jgi:hypothetical protein
MNKVSNDNITHVNADNHNIKNVNDTATNDNFEFDFAMCHGSYFYCRYR